MKVDAPRGRGGKLAKNKSLLAHLQEKDSSSEHDLILYEYHDKPPSGDQGLTFQTHALQMILFGPFYVQTQYHFGVVTNCVLTIGAVCGKGLCLGAGGGLRQSLTSFPIAGCSVLA